MMFWSHAFSHPVDDVGDAIRLIDMVLGIVLIGLFLGVAKRVRNTRQWGMYALVCFAIAAIDTEVQNLGTVVTFRLVVNTAGVVFGLIFLWKNRGHS